MNCAVRCTRSLAVLTLSLGLLVTAPARAQTVDPQRALAAQALYEQATAEMDAKSFASACRKLEEVTRLVPEGLGAKLTLGQCYEAQGRLASAWSQYALAQAMAAKLGQDERAQAAGQKAAALKPRLATMTVEVPDAVRAIPGITVTRDGVQLGDPQWGTALPADAGSHHIVVTAPGYETWKKQVEVVADGARVTVKLQPLKADRSAPGNPASPAARLPVAPAPPDRRWQRPVGLAAMISGNVGIGAGLIVGVFALAKNNESNRDNHCDAKNRCDATGLALRNEAMALGNGATAAFVAGAAVLGGGVVLYVTAPAPSKKEKPPEKGTPKRSSARVSLGLGGVLIQGAWK